MENSMHLLMTETSPEICRLCKMALPAQNIQVSVCSRNGTTAYNALEEHQPDAVLLDVFMPEMDAMALKSLYDENHPGHAVQFYATGTFQNEELEREVMESGFAFYYLKPFDVTALANRLLRHQQQHGQKALGGNSSMGQEDMVTDMLRMIGVPAHIKGYRFLRESVLRTVEDPTLINAVTKILYPEIAATYNTTASRVERAIRHAIEVAWDRGDIDILNFYFGSTIHASRGKPTNSEFIAMLADRVGMAQKRRA